MMWLRIGIARIASDNDILAEVVVVEDVELEFCAEFLEPIRPSGVHRIAQRIIPSVGQSMVGYLVTLNDMPHSSTKCAPKVRLVIAGRSQS